jgi:hypothetical protein
MHRRVKIQRLAAAGHLWAFAALIASAGARAHYDRRRTAGDRHIAAQRNLFNRLIGCLYHCLETRQPYNENIATRFDTLSAWNVFMAEFRDHVVRDLTVLPRQA